MGAISKLHVGFPEVSLAKYSRILVDSGLKVCVVEQVEQEKEAAEGKKPTTFQERKVVSILSKGLFSLEGSNQRDLQSLVSYEP